MKQIALPLALAAVAVLAFAQPASEPIAPAVRGAAASSICGGIGQPEAQALKAQAAGHDLMLTFATAAGAYLADVQVSIADARGHVVLDGMCDGPIMLVDLPSAGTWRITASVDGITRQQTLTTSRGHTARATMVWPADQS
jgi:hypothetical protein